MHRTRVYAFVVYHVCNSHAGYNNIRTKKVNPRHILCSLTYLPFLLALGPRVQFVHTSPFFRVFFFFFFTSFFNDMYIRNAHICNYYISFLPFPLLVLPSQTRQRTFSTNARNRRALFISKSVFFSASPFASFFFGNFFFLFFVQKLQFFLPLATLATLCNNTIRTLQL